HTRSKRDWSSDVCSSDLTSLNTLTMGSKVNLERSMTANGRYGGHFVSGHVDGIGKIITKQKQGNAIYYTIEINDEFSKFLLKKGSIAVDGVSLTVFEHSANTFTISLIPHTTSQTVLGLKGQGDIVNIECDMLAKYVNQIVGGPGKQKIDEGFLQTNGFM